MVQAAIAGRPKFSLSTIEIDRGGVSYTADTLREMHAEQPDWTLFFLMGADALHEFPAWREPAAICELATLLVVRRAGAPPPDFRVLTPLVSADRLAAIEAAQVEMPETPISSSHIRRLVAEEGDWRPLVAPAVADYIDAHHLYS
jgi:nicotinate-nucleotide adenylyltransferase